jgi:hypothetical protein
MPKIGLVAFLFFMTGSGYAQQNYFVLIRADNNQPFYARIGVKAFSSSAQGHLIIPQLRDSTYIITIGFPRQLFPERDFSVAIKKNDLEFQLKDLGEKGWGLFSPQTMELKMPVRIDTADTRFRPEGVKKDDAFSRLMAGVVSDTAVMYNTYAQEEPGKKDTTRRAPAVATSLQPGTTAAQPGTTTAQIPQTPGSQIPGAQTAASQNPRTPVNQTVSPDSSFRPTPPVLNTSAKMDSATAGPVIPASGGSGGTASPGVTARSAGFVPKAANRHKGVFIEKLGEQKTGAMWKLTYADHANGRPVDTILIIIPVDSGGLATAQRAADTVKKASPGLAGAETTPKGTAMDGVAKNSTDAVVRNNTDAGAKSSTDVGARNSTDTGATKNGSDPGVKSKKPAPAVVNSDCKAFAGDYDIDKLRLKLLASPKEEDKILIAKKVFKFKCFSSAQIRALCEVFTADAGKYRFLEAAYPFVWDDHFRGLSDILTDPSYVGRFRTMTGQ